MASTANEIILSSMGQYGGKVIANTNATTPDGGYVFTAIMALETTVINTTTGNVTSLSSLTVPALAIIPGRFTSVTLTSGKVIAYHGV